LKEKEKKRVKKPYLLRGLTCSLVMVIALSLSFGSSSILTTPVVTHAGAAKFDVQRPLGVTPNWQAEKKISLSGGSSNGATSLPSCLSNPTPTWPRSPRCYSPQQIREAYNVNGLLNAGITGKGQTIVIIDQSSSTTLQNDLHLYDQLFGLNDPVLHVIAPFGMPPEDGGYSETALDVQTAHSLAPDATIDLVLTGDTTNDQTQESFFYDLLKPVKYAIDHNLGSSISISYGGGESCFDRAFLRYEHTIFQKARDKKISVFVSSGDFGAAIYPSCTSPTMTTRPFAVKGVNILAADPLVTGVGGTTLNAEIGSGTYIGETAWNTTFTHLTATGGGFSSDFSRPGYQEDVPGIRAMRGLPDVAWDGDTFTGVVEVDHSYSGFGGGTSAGAPSWAGLSALFDQYAGKRLGFLNEALYRILKSRAYLQGFRDITTGNNSVTGYDANGTIIPVAGYDAGPGWDATTGVGTPNVSALAPLLKRYIHPGDGNAL